MSTEFEGDVDPYLSARQARHLRGSIPLAKMHRLTALLQSAGGDVEVEMQFALADGGRAQLTLAIKAVLIAQCQRCLEAMEYPLSCKRRLMMVDDQAQIDTLPPGYEPVLVENQQLALIPLVEDELLLSLPIVFKHEHCAAAVTTAGESETSTVLKRENPFAVLEQLKNSKEPK